jgi:hypothetical protein
MRKLLIILTLLTVTAGFSQVAIRKSSVSTGGGSASGGNLYMVYAIGEIGVQEADAGNLHLSEGFVGPDITQIVGIENYGTLEGLNIFPNPVKTNVNIELPETGNYEIYIYDLTGKQLLQNKVEDDYQVQINMSNYKTGVYIMAIVDRTGKKAKTVKLQKL